MMSFTQLNLNPSISKALQACGYTEPTPIQSSSIPGILEGKDIVACAQTGTGKTAAFVLPALHRLAEIKGGSKPRVLILTPTRELATQIMDAVAKYGKFMQLNLVSLVGGMPYRQQLQGLSRAVDIIVATPGRLLDHMQTGRVKLSDIEMLILDEADRMLDMGFIDDVKEIAKATSANRQTLLFSATVDGKLDKIIKQLLKDPIRIDLSQAKLSPVKIKQEIYMADNVQHKTRLLQHFIKDGNIFKAIIFSATKVNADRLTKQLHGEGHSVAALHGDLKQNVRNRTIEAMRRGKIQFLIATDVAARGIDINDITHVINFDLPKFHEDYVHRIGRTGRAGKSGTAISFALPDDGRHLQGIERYIGEKIVLSTVSGLEASKSFNFSATKKKRGRGAGGGGHGKPGHKSNGFKGGASSSKKEGYRGDSGRSASFRGDSAKSEGARTGGFKGESARGARSSSFGGDNARTTHFRSDSPRSEGARSGGYRGDSAGRDGGRSGGFRGDSAGREGGRTSGFRGDSARSTSFRSDSTRSEGARNGGFRGDGAGRGEGRSGGFRGDSAGRESTGRSGFRGGDSGGRSSSRGDSSGRESNGRSNFRGNDNAGRESKGRSFKSESNSNSRDDFKGKRARSSSKSDGFKSSRTKKEFSER